MSVTTTAPLEVRTDDGLLVTIEMELVTPDKAREYLGFNRSNRNIRKAHWTAQASDMKRGRWQLTHMSIAFDKNGKLIDGQHRLLAIEDSGIAQWMLVVRGLEPSVQEVIDTSAARTGADALKLSGRVPSNHPAVAAAARIAILWGEGHHVPVRTGVNGARKVTNSEITEWVDEQNALSEGQLAVTGAVGLARTWHRVNNLMSLSVTSFAVLVLGTIDYEDMETFFTRLEGLNFEEDLNDPIKQLYERLNYAKMNKEQFRISEYLFYVFTAWNAYRQGGTIQFVSLRAGGKFVPNKKITQPKVDKAGVKIYARVPEPV